MGMEFTARTREILEAARTECPEPRSVLISALQIAMEEFGHLSDDVLSYVAAELEIPESIVAGVATFYHNLHTQPRGKHVISICRTLPCELAGGSEVASRFMELLDIGFGETTADGLITLVSAECLACCGTSPAVQIDYDYFESFRPELCEAVIEAIRRGERPPGGSGVPGGLPEDRENPGR